MLFAYDINLIDQTSEGLGWKLDRWREELESKGFRINHSKTKYLACNFGLESRERSNSMEIEGMNIPECEASIIQKNGAFGEDVTHMIKVGWMRMMSRFLCDRRMSTRLTGNCYKIILFLPALLYGSEYWTTMEQHTHKMTVAKMCMLRWMCGKICKDKIKN